MCHHGTVCIYVYTGGTVDVTVYESLENGALKELYSATGGAWGGTTVDAAYIQLLTDIVGYTVMENWARENMEDWLILQRDFEVKKREISNDDNDTIVIRWPLSLLEGCKSTRKLSPADLVAQSKYKGQIDFKRDKLLLHPDLARSLFDTTIDNIVRHIKKLLAEPEVGAISTILMVGGCSESPLVKDAIRIQFTHIQVIFPADAGLAVLKGAVLYGHRPEVIRARVARHTYGIGVSDLFDASRHPVDKKFIRDGEERCRGIFKIFVQQGETISTGQTVTHRLWAHADQTTLSLPLYTSPSRSPQYTTDPGCTLLGEVDGDMSDTVGRIRDITVHMSFGDTEITAKVVEDGTGKSWDTTFDFLG